MLLAVGALLVDSSSMSSREFQTEPVQLYKHLSFLMLALLGGTAAAILPRAGWRYVGPIIYLITITLLVVVLVPGIGHRVNGAQRWIRVGGWTMQPSELAKISVPLAVCLIRFRPEKDESASPQLREAFLILLMIALPVGLIFVAPDLGTGLFVTMGATLAVFLSGWPVRHFFLAGALVIPAIVGLLAIKPYQVARIEGFVRTWQNPESAPYQVKQSLTTLGVGGLQGTGLGRGRQKLSFLPEADTDFVFSVIGEELGLIGTLSVIGLWIGLYLCGTRLISQVRSGSFESVLATTLLLQLVLQAAINVAVVTAMLPPKGISHPFISYGGSNLVTSVFALGMILSLTRPDSETSVELENDPLTEDGTVAI